MSDINSIMLLTKRKAEDPLDNDAKRSKIFNCETLSEVVFARPYSRRELLELPNELLEMIAQRMEARCLLNFSRVSKRIYDITRPTIRDKCCLKIRDWDHENGDQLILTNLLFLYSTDREYIHIKMDFKYGVQLLKPRFFKKYGHQIKTFSLVCAESGNTNNIITGTYLLSLFKDMPNIEEIFISNSWIDFDITEDSAIPNLPKLRKIDWTEGSWCLPIDIFASNWLYNLDTLNFQPQIVDEEPDEKEVPTVWTSFFQTEKIKEMVYDSEFLLIDVSYPKLTTLFNYQITSAADFENLIRRTSLKNLTLTILEKPNVDWKKFEQLKNLEVLKINGEVKDILLLKMPKVQELDITVAGFDEYMLNIFENYPNLKKLRIEMSLFEARAFEMFENLMIPLQELEIVHCGPFSPYRLSRNLDFKHLKKLATTRYILKELKFHNFHAPKLEGLEILRPTSGYKQRRVQLQACEIVVIFKQIKHLTIHQDRDVIIYNSDFKLFADNLTELESLTIYENENGLFTQMGMLFLAKAMNLREFVLHETVYDLSRKNILIKTLKNSYGKEFRVQIL